MDIVGKSCMFITSGSYKVKLWKYGKSWKKNFTVPILFEV